MRPADAVHLLYQTTRCSFLEQEKNSALGMLWHLLNPLAMTLVIYVVFSSVARFGDIPQYGLFILVGIVHFNFFSIATARSASGMLGSRNLILNTTVPREVLVMRSVCLDGLAYLIELLVVLGLVMIVGNGLTWNALYYLPVLAGMFMFSTGVAMFIASAVVFLTDLVYIWTVATRMLFFLTPIFYEMDFVEVPLARRLIELNPLTQMVLLGRKTLLHGEALQLHEIGVALIGPLVALAVGWGAFQMFKHRIPDYI